MLFGSDSAFLVEKKVKNAIYSQKGEGIESLKNIMLGINLIFAGFVLTLNGVGYFKKIDDKAKAVINLLVGVIIAINAVIQVVFAMQVEYGAYLFFGFAAAGWLFAMNYFVLAAHILLKSESWNGFGLYGLFASLVSVAFAVYTFVTANGNVHLILLGVLWVLWAILWAQTFASIFLGSKKIDKITPHTLIFMGIVSTFVPGILILTGVFL